MPTDAKYFYKPHLGGFRVFERINEFESESVPDGHFYLQEKARELTYKLNGWNYTNQKNKNMSEDPIDYNKKSTEIQLVQVPVIVYKLKEVGLSVTKRIEELNLDKQIVTYETIQFLKTTRAELNKEAVMWETQRKTVKNGIMAPYDEFELVYKQEIIDKYEAADTLLKDNIGAFELKLRTERKNNIIAYFNELVVVEGLEWLKFEKLNIDVIMSVTEKKYKEQVLAFVTKTKSDIDLINSEEFAPEMLVEYKQTLNASKAITDVRERKRKAKEEAAALKLQETTKRETSLRNLGMVWHDMSKTFNWVRDETVLISRNDIETSSPDEWIARFAKVKETISTKTAEMANSTAASPQYVGSFSTPTNKTPEVLKAPVKEEPAQLPSPIHIQNTCNLLIHQEWKI